MRTPSTRSPQALKKGVRGNAQRYQDAQYVMSLHPGQAEVFRDKSRFRVVVAGRRFGKCVHAETLITMADGSERKVEDVSAGDWVLTVNEDTYQLETRQVQHLHDNGVKETVVVKTKSGRELRCTPNHPILANNAWIDAGALNKGDLLATPMRSEVMGESEQDFLPITYDDLLPHLIGDGEPGARQAHNTVVGNFSRSTKDVLNSWRKQTKTRISRRRYEQLRYTSDGYFDSLADGDIHWDEVESVTPAEPAQTYDLTIEGNHNFIADGIFTHNTMLAKSVLMQKSRIPNQLLWYVAPTYKQAKQIMWRDLKKSMPREWLRKDPNETALSMELINGTVIELKGSDKADSLRGVGLDFVILDEVQDMRKEVWTEVLRPTLATTGGGGLFIGTPKGYQNVLYELFEIGQKPKMIKAGTWRSWHFKTLDSPFVAREEVEAARADLDERTFLQEFCADFNSTAGLVYYPFDRNTHVKSCPFNPKLPIWIGQDFNIDPMATCILQPQPNGEVWVVDEIVIPNSNTEEVANEIERRYWRYFRQITMYPDSNASARQHARGETDLDIFREKGLTRFRNRRKNPPIADRINAVNRMLQTADGRVRLYFSSEQCPNTIKAMEQVAYKEGTREVDKSQNIEHISDALGYVIEREFPLNQKIITGLSI